MCMRELRDFYKFLSQGKKYRKSGIKSSMQRDFLTFVARNLLLIVSKFNTDKINIFWHLILKLTDGNCVLETQQNYDSLLAILTHLANLALNL